MKLFGDPRPRNNQGEFSGQDTAGMDPGSMNVAYDPAIIAQRKRVLAQKTISEIPTGEQDKAFSMNIKLKELAARHGLKEFGRGDRAIPALKRIIPHTQGATLATIGTEGAMVPSLRGNAANVRRAHRKFWEEDISLGEATQVMKANRKWAAQEIKGNLHKFTCKKVKSFARGDMAGKFIAANERLAHLIGPGSVHHGVPIESVLKKRFKTGTWGGQVVPTLRQRASDEIKHERFVDGLKKKGEGRGLADALRNVYRAPIFGTRKPPVKGAFVPAIS